MQNYLPGWQTATVLGPVNFAGDLGQMVTPALVGFAAVAACWRATLLGPGVFAAWSSPGGSVADVLEWGHDRCP
jgi:hypothetical protein